MIKQKIKNIQNFEKKLVKFRDSVVIDDSMFYDFLSEREATPDFMSVFFIEEVKKLYKSFDFEGFYEKVENFEDSDNIGEIDLLLDFLSIADDWLRDEEGFEKKEFSKKYEQINDLKNHLIKNDL